MREKDLNGKELAGKIKEDLKCRISDFTAETCIVPKLAIVCAGDDPSSATYIKSKQKTCKKLGVETLLLTFSESISLKQLQTEIQKLNEDESIHGIIIEMPLPSHIPFLEAVAVIDPVKDVDGLHPANMGWLVAGNPYYIPNTPMAVMKLLKSYRIPISGRDVTIVGRSLAVGKPLASLLLAEDATVTLCHSKTANLKEKTLSADILISAVGRPGLISADMVREGAVVVDVGINITPEGLRGDVDYQAVYPKAGWITPVPGGVGPVTVSMIIENTLSSAIIQYEAKNPGGRIVSLNGGCIN